MIGACHTAPYSNSASSSYSNFGSSSLGQYTGTAGGYSDGGGGSPQVIEVSPEQLPVQVHFRTASSRVNVQQSHNPSLAPQVEHASFQDEPHRVVSFILLNVLFILVFLILFT